MKHARDVPAVKNTGTGQLVVNSRCLCTAIQWGSPVVVDCPIDCEAVLSV